MSATTGPAGATNSLYSVGVVAHKTRISAATHLADEVRACYVSIDDGALGCEGNHRRVWEYVAAIGGGYWTVVLEDDAVPVDDFAAQLTAVLEHAPTAIVSLYLGRSRPPQWQQRIERATGAAEAANASFIEYGRLLHGVGVAIKTRLVPDMLDTVGGHACRTLPIDEAISAWARANGYRVAYTWPSLVDHADGPTVASHRDRQARIEPRTAWRAGTRAHWGTAQITM